MRHPVEQEDLPKFRCDGQWEIHGRIKRFIIQVGDIKSEEMWDVLGWLVVFISVVCNILILSTI